MNVLLISGSLRMGSTNTALLLTMRAAAPDGITATFYEGLNELPHYNPDHDVEPLHPAVADLRSRLKTAEAVVLSTPEYAGALPGAFKNALDWMVGEPAVDRMPVAWVNASSIASPTGGADAHASLRKVLGYLNAQIVEAACVRIPMQRDYIGANSLIADASIRRQLAGVFRALRIAINELAQ